MENNFDLSYFEFGMIVISGTVDPLGFSHLKVFNFTLSGAKNKKHPGSSNSVEIRGQRRVGSLVGPDRT